jgi:hypothetical protein
MSGAGTVNAAADAVSRTWCTPAAPTFQMQKQFGALEHSFELSATKNAST